jgi:hypothetical protein
MHIRPLEWRFVNPGEPPSERCSPEVMHMARKDARLLPVIQWDGSEFLVDVDRRQFRNLNDAHDSIGMHSLQGRAVVRQMQDTEWRVFAVDSGGQEDVAV